MLDLVFWWAGAVVCSAGALAGVTFAVMYPIDYCWRRWGDVRMLIAAHAEARRQGRTIWRK
jgi:hypothetical protein